MSHDSKEQFYQELRSLLHSDTFTSEEFAQFINSFDDSADSGFYELCSKFADIGLNAPKQADPVTCEVQACFQYSDCDAAKAAFRDYVSSHNLTNVDGVLDAVRQMHRLAVAWDDPRCKGGLVRPKDYNWGPGFGGKNHNFCELPDDIWKMLSDEIRTECRREN